MMKILITGGAGFIGSAITNLLASQENQIIVYDNLSPQIHGQFSLQSERLKSLPENAKIIIGDILNKEQLKVAMMNCDLLIHLAAETGTGQSMYQINKYTKTNIVGTSNIVDILTNEKTNIKKIIYASTRAVYGEGKYSCKKHGSVFVQDRNLLDLKEGDFDCKCPICNETLFVEPTDEDTKPNSKSFYAVSKLSSEQILMTQCKALDIDFVALRLQNVYGEGQSLSNPYTGILSIFSTLMLQNKPINIFEDGKESRDFVHIADVARAFAIAVKSDNMQGIYNVGSSKQTSVIEIAEKLKKIYNSKSEFDISGDFRLGDIRHNFANIDKIKEYGWVPSISLDLGLDMFTKWVMAQNFSESNGYSKSLEELKEKGMFITK